MKFLPYMISLSLTAGFVAEAFPTPAPENGVTVQTCTGGTVYIDFGQPENPPLPPAHKLKPCHAICCSDESDSDYERGDDDREDVPA